MNTRSEYPPKTARWLRPVLCCLFAASLLICSLPIHAAKDTSFSYIPKFRACLKTKYELDLTDMNSRFNVRNARVGVTGQVASWVSYRFQMDLTDEGQFRILDADIRLTPMEGLNLSFGQTKILFLSDNICSPTDMIYANRTFITKFLAGSSRDIGLTVSYQLPTKLPLAVDVGVYNGSGINNPEWSKKFLMAARIALGKIDDWQVLAKTQQGYYRDGRLVHTYDIEGRYVLKAWELQAEVLYRDSKKDHLISHEMGAYFQGGYTIPLKLKKMPYLQPNLRWDMLGDINNQMRAYQRLTIGLNLGFNMKPLWAELRLNYEAFFGNRDLVPLYYGTNEHGANDKLTLELLINI